MSSSVDSPKRIAFVIGAQTGEELAAGNRDVAQIYLFLTDPTLGSCSNESPKPNHECRSRDEFQKTLNNVVKNWQSSDQLIFYFTGHGEIVGGTYCLQVGLTEDDFLPFNNILNDLQIRKVRRAILILDTCYSGAAAKAKSPKTLSFLEQYRLPKGIAIIASSRASETSLELPDGSSSIFTHLFCMGINTGLNGTKTADGFITVGDIVNFVNNELESNEKYADYFQRPVFKVEDAERSIWISHNISGSGTKKSNADLQTIVTSLEELKFLYENTTPSKHPCPQATNKDLKWDLIKGFMRDVYQEEIEDLSKEEMLTNLKLYSPIPHQGKPTLHKSAVLCFSKRPDLFYEQVKSIFVVGNPRDKFFGRDDITGPLSRQVTKLFEKVKENLNTISYIAENGIRHDKLEIDEDVVRELISNAITHRNYETSGSVTITVNKDALEVRSPGGFPPRVSWSKLLSSEESLSCPINIAISHYLTNQLTFEGIGRGFDVIKQYILQNGENSIICKELPGPITLVRVLRPTPQEKPQQVPTFVKPMHRPPRITFFVNRERELKKLLDALQPGRIVTLCGPGGIGKTALATEAVWVLTTQKELPEKFPDGIFFHSFYNQPQANLALESIALTFGEEPRPTPKAAAQRALSGKQALLLIDGAEDADDLSLVLSVTDSCGVLITSRSRKDASEQRQDLRPLTADESIEMLKVWGGEISVDDTSAKRICKIVGGLPLAVMLVGRYLSKTGETATEYLKWLEESPLEALDLGKRQPESVPLLLKKSLAKVSSQANKVLGVVGLLALAPFSREPLAAALELKAPQLVSPLGELVNYGLLLSSEGQYDLSHALIHTYARKHLVPNGNTLECLAKYYSEFILQQSKRDLGGYAALDTERAHILQVLFASVRAKLLKPAIDIVIALDHYLDLQGYYLDWIQALETGLAAARQLGDKQNESYFLGKIGSAFRALGQVEEAINYHEKALVISREIGDRHSEGRNLGNLGTTYSDLGQVEKAIEYYEQALLISREIKDRRGEANRLGNLGIAYRTLGQIKKTVEYHEQALKISREIGDRRGEGSDLGNLGNVYNLQGDLQKAIKYYTQALKISIEIGDLRAEGNRLGNIGNAYLALGQLEEAIKFYKKALLIAQEIGDRGGEGSNLGNLGNAYLALGQLEEAIKYHTKALVISREIGDLRSEGSNLRNLGAAYSDLGKVEKAKKYLNQSLEIFEKIKSPNAETIRNWLNELE